MERKSYTPDIETILSRLLASFAEEDVRKLQLELEICLSIAMVLEKKR